MGGISLAGNKTNVMRILDKAHIPHQEYTYDHSDGKIDGVAVAEKMGQPLEQVYKTLVTKGSGRKMCIRDSSNRSCAMPVLWQMD